MDEKQQNLIQNEDNKEHSVIYEQTDIWVKTSRSGEHLTFDLEGQNYRIPITEFTLFLNEIVDTCILYLPVIVGDTLQLKETNKIARASKSGKALLIPYKEDILTTPIYILKEIVEGRRKGTFLSKLIPNPNHKGA